MNQKIQWLYVFDSLPGQDFVLVVQQVLLKRANEWNSHTYHVIQALQQEQSNASRNAFCKTVFPLLVHQVRWY